MQLKNYQFMQGRVQTTLGGNLSMNSSSILPGQQTINIASPFTPLKNQGPGQTYIAQAEAEANLNQQINQLASAASLNHKAKQNYTLKVQLS